MIHGMRPTVRQLIVGASRADAITNMAIGSSRSIAELAESEIYAFHPVEADLEGEIRHVSDMGNGAPRDVLVYHSSFGIPQITQLLRKRPERLVLVYHNITPADRYWDLSPDFAAALEWGRVELTMLRDKVAVAVADSEFNGDELRAIGYRDVRVIPAGVNPHRLNSTPIDSRFNRELTDNFPDGFLLFVSQVIPHKRVEWALEVVHLLRSVHRLNVGLVVAGPQRNPRYSEIVQRFRSLLPEANSLFLGEATESQLATLYRRASVFIGTSDHEGLGIPPLEAMAAGCPVVIRGCGAVPETVGDGALMIGPESGVLEFTEAVAEVLSNQELRVELARLGLDRAFDIGNKGGGESFREVVEEVLG